jgi:hypothetical protein
MTSVSMRLRLNCSSNSSYCTLHSAVIEERPDVQKVCDFGHDSCSRLQPLTELAETGYPTANT